MLGFQSQFIISNNVFDFHLDIITTQDQNPPIWQQEG